jgi:hypothetical protein
MDWIEGQTNSVGTWMGREGSVLWVGLRAEAWAKTIARASLAAARAKEVERVRAWLRENRKKWDIRRQMCETMI